MGASTFPGGMIRYHTHLSAVRPFHRQANSDFCWPIGHFYSDGWGDGVIGLGMGSGVASTCMEVLWKFLGFLSGPFFSFFLLFIMEPSAFFYMFYVC